MNNLINTKEYNQVYPNHDYVQLRNYNASFYNRNLTSQLRMAIAPGSLKYISNYIEPQNIIDDPNAATSVSYDNDTIVKSDKSEGFIKQQSPNDNSDYVKCGNARLF
jgi:hypothetical protein